LQIAQHQLVKDKYKQFVINSDSNKQPSPETEWCTKILINREKIRMGLKKKLLFLFFLSIPIKKFCEYLSIKQFLIAFASNIISMINIRIKSIQTYTGQLYF